MNLNAYLPITIIGSLRDGRRSRTRVVGSSNNVCRYPSRYCSVLTSWHGRSKDCEWMTFHIPFYHHLLGFINICRHRACIATVMNAQVFSKRPCWGSSIPSWSKNLEPVTRYARVQWSLWSLKNYNHSKFMHDMATVTVFREYQIWNIYTDKYNKRSKGWRSKSKNGNDLELLFAKYF